MPTFCELLEKAITDEKEAIKGYEELEKIENLYPTKIDGIKVNDLIIIPIKKDEEKHLETLKELKEGVCK